jgi:hypothetical protein
MTDQIFFFFFFFFLKQKDLASQIKEIKECIDTLIKERAKEVKQSHLSISTNQKLSRNGPFILDTSN